MFFLVFTPFHAEGFRSTPEGGDVEIASWSEAEVMEIRASLGGGKRLERPTSWDQSLNIMRLWLSERACCPTMCFRIK